ncbi:hypothetical protein MMC28_004799 [Mycoblastus sanguinarius]|nr:hypothetical protein [Mycoblastus sanguinarius]
MSSSTRPILAIVSLVLIAGALLLTLFVLIGGGSDHNPTNQFYFLEATTTGIPNAAPTTRWTLWNACSVVNGRNACPKVHPAYPLDPPRNFGSTTGVPKQFIGTHQYYYLTRFMFAFILIGAFFGACSLFLGGLALCSRIGSFLSSALCSIALFFQTITAALMTAAYVKGRDAFKSNGMHATLGKDNFGFMWAAMACYLIATVLLCAGGAASGSSGRPKESRSGGRMFFGRKQKNNHQRGSFIDKETAVDGDRSSFERNGA